uniref:Reverse transcriptase zinc-binding domain-containing protein n=1 Tax=Micrurus spixii TaxID=129469 RepID=A0A2D4M009_9SAUR
MEAMFHPNTMDISKKLKYHQILNKEGKLKSIYELEAQGLSIDQWSYLQVAMRYDRDAKEFGLEIKNTQLDKIFLGQEKNMISKLYNYLIEFNLTEEIVKGPMIVWANFFGYNINLNDWEEIWHKNLTLTKSVSYKENLYKMLYRWHLAPSRLAKMYPKVNSTCWKCKGNNGTFFHLWWKCPEITKFWIRIKVWIEEIIQDRLKWKLELFLLGIIKRDYSLRVRYLIIHILMNFTGILLEKPQCTTSIFCHSENIPMSRKRKPYIEIKRER